MNIALLDYYIDRDHDLLLSEPNARLSANISRWGGRLRGLTVLQRLRWSITNTRHWASDLISALASPIALLICVNHSETLSLNQWMRAQYSTYYGKVNLVPSQISFDEILLPWLLLTQAHMTRLFQTPEGYWNECRYISMQFEVTNMFFSLESFPGKKM